MEGGHCGSWDDTESGTQTLSHSSAPGSGQAMMEEL